MATRREWWTELQRGRAGQARHRQQQFREFQRAEAQAARDAAKAERDRRWQAAVEGRERQQLYVDARRAEAAAANRSTPQPAGTPPQQPEQEKAAVRPAAKVIDNASGHYPARPA